MQHMERRGVSDAAYGKQGCDAAYGTQGCE